MIDNLNITDFMIDLKNKSDSVISRGWIECANVANGSAGLLLERLLGLNNHNLPIPDYNGIEIKTKFVNNNTKLALFTAAPDGCLFATKRLFENYGYPDHNNSNFKAFHMSFTSTRRKYVNKYIYAKIYVDRKDRKVVLKFFNFCHQVIDSDISWSFDMLKKKFDIKMRYLFIMYVKKTRFQGKNFYKYISYNFFMYKGFESFIIALEKGYIKITFAIDIFKSKYRFGCIHDHGTSFNIDIEHIEKLFTSINLDDLMTIK